MQKCIFYCIILWLSVTVAFAQTGVISGKITEQIDENTLEEAIGVTVVIEGTTIGAATDMEGNYRISNVKPGTYNLLISYIGYKSQKITDVVVEADKITTINVTIEEDVEQLGDIVVIGFRETDSDIAVVEEVRKSEAVANGISSEQIEKSQDGDAAEVMQRVPGITILENRFVMVRGVSDRYNNVMINNVIAPSTEVDIRSFAFDLIPSSVIDRMLIYKSGSPEMPGDFAGGMIKVFTKNNVEENFTTVILGVGYRNNTTFQPYISSEGSPTDFLGFDNGFRSLPNNFPDTRTLQESGRASELRQAAGQSLNNNFGNSQRTALPDLNMGFALGRKFEIGRVKISNITALNYSNAYEYRFTDRYRYFFFDPENPIQQRFAYEDDTYRNNVRIGLIHNWRAAI
ncbi:MAG: carboxypeptidase-like regulatory domain-containing protein [Bernardetiaceae bacterium]|nr:carboxypeptidase-like regulatory domain-containing protein [Bernardetiaceae bacterium]